MQGTKDSAGKGCCENPVNLGKLVTSLARPWASGDVVIKTNIQTPCSCRIFASHQKVTTQPQIYWLGPPQSYGKSQGTGFPALASLALWESTISYSIIHYHQPTEVLAATVAFHPKKCHDSLLEGFETHHPHKSCESCQSQHLVVTRARGCHGGATGNPL